MHLVTGLIIRGTGGHHIEKLIELDLSTAVLVQFGNHLVDGLRLGLDTERVDGHLQFCMRGGVPLGSMAPPRSRSK
jgi:hypothetical protein